MKRFKELFDSVAMESLFEKNYFHELVSELCDKPVSDWTTLPPVGPVRGIEDSSGQGRRSIEHVLPDRPDHLYLSVYPQRLGDPMSELVSHALLNKPYSDAVRYVADPYLIESEDIFGTLDEAQRDDTPVTIITATRDVPKIIGKMIEKEKFYQLPAGSRWFHAALPLDEAQSLGYSLISLVGQTTGIGPQSTVSLYGGNMFPSYAWSLNSQHGYKLPPWIEAFSPDNDIIICDLSAQKYPVFRTGHRGRVEGRLVYLSAIAE